MSKGLHVGCLCVVVRSVFPENLGREVEVTEYDPNDKQGFCWKILPTSGEPLVGGRLGQGTLPLMEAWARARHLSPITPDESITQETDREVVV